MKMAKAEVAGRALLAFTEAFNRHDRPAMLALLSEDCLLEHFAPAPNGARVKGKEAIAQFWDHFFTALPQAHCEIEDLLSLGWWGVARWTLRWISPEGQKHIRGVSLVRLKEGQIIEHLSYVKGEV